jgi:Carboxypeptidase regulatory-like domain
MLLKIRRPFIVFLFTALIAISQPSLKAQTQTGSIVGTVQDVAGSILVSAKITLEPTGRQTATNDQGQFRMGDLPAGDYTVTISYVGFAPSTIPVKVQSGQLATVNPTLQVASGADTVMSTRHVCRARLKRSISSACLRISFRYFPNA